MTSETARSLYYKCRLEFDRAHGDNEKQKQILKEYSELFAPIAKILYSKERLYEYVVKVGKDNWETIQEIYFITPRNLGIIKPGFPTDLCTNVPESDWWYACIVHDWLYAYADTLDISVCSKICFRRNADLDLMYLMRAVSSKWYSGIAGLTYFHGVRLYG